MRAAKGDWIVIKGHLSGQPERHGQVLEAKGAESSAPFVVHWTDTEHETLFFPGPDATVVHPTRRSR